MGITGKKREYLRMMETMKKRPAFTLIEVLVALSVVAIAVIALLRLQLISIQMADRSQGKVQAASLADQKIAELMMAGIPAPGTQTGTIEQDGRNYHWRTEVTDWKLPDSVKAEVTMVRRILAEVYWYEGKKEKRIELVSGAADRNMP